MYALKVFGERFGRRTFIFVARQHAVPCTPYHPNSKGIHQQDRLIICLLDQSLEELNIEDAGMGKGNVEYMLDWIYLLKLTVATQQHEGEVGLRHCTLRHCTL